MMAVPVSIVDAMISFTSVAGYYGVDSWLNLGLNSSFFSVAVASSLWE